MASNQVHPPGPKKTCADSLGNDSRRMYLKDGDSTMLFVRGLTENGCIALINSINTTLKKLGHATIPRNKFLITRGK